MTATTQPESKPTSRRALLAGVLAGLGAFAASAIGRPPVTRAGSDGDVRLGDSNNVASTLTRVVNQSNSNTALQGESSSFGVGLLGRSASGLGVYGISASGPGMRGDSGSSYGVQGASDNNSGLFGFSTASTRAATVGWARGPNAGVSSTGVQGYSGTALPTAKTKTGVYGEAGQDASSSGVWGHSPSGVGVRGSTTNGFAGWFGGRVFTTSFYEMGEITSPGAPSANRARLFVRDDGFGKTQLCVKFANGTVTVLATEG